MDAMQLALTKLAMSSPFIASAALRMNWVVDPDINTLATDGTDVFYNAEWFKTLTMPMQLFCVAHESLHAMLQHCAMMRKWVDSGFGPDGLAFDKNRMGQAMDYLINGSLLAEKEFTAPTMPNGGQICLKRGVNLSYCLVTMYNELKGEGGEGGKELDEHRPQVGEPVVKPSDVVAGAMTAKALTGGQGTHSAITDAVCKMIAPLESSPWARLRDKITRGGVDGESSWSKPQRHLLVRGIIAPSVVGKKSQPIAVVLDISGSVHALIPEFLSHVAAICVDAKPERLLVLFVDDRIRAQYEYDSVADFMAEIEHMKVPMGGGSSMQPGLDRAVESGYERVICLTDGYFTHPKTFNGELVWACTTNVTFQVGDVVRI